MLLAKILDANADVDKACNQTISFYRLGDALLSIDKGNPLARNDANFYLMNRRGISPYVFPVGGDDNIKARMLAFLLSDDLLRRLIFCDFYIVENDRDVAFIEGLANGRKVAAISICDDTLLGNKLYGGIIRWTHNLEELSPRTMVADTPCLMPLSAKFMPLLTRDNMEKLPKLLLSLIPLFYSARKPIAGEPNMLRALYVLNESASWHWSYKGVPYRIELSSCESGKGSFLELEASLISEVDGSATSLFGSGFDISQLEMLLNPYDMDLGSCNAKIRVVDQHGELDGCIDWDNESCSHAVHHGKGKLILGPKVDEEARRELNGHVIRLPEAGYYGSGQLRLRADRQMAKAELMKFDFSSGAPHPRSLASRSFPPGDGGISGIRGEFGRLLESMNVYCDRYQPYRASMVPYYETVTACVSSRGPLRLFRFRSLADPETSELNLEDIRQDRVFLAHARDFNDLYDSFPLLNYDMIREQMDKQITKDNMLRTLKADASLYGKRLAGEGTRSMADFISQFNDQLEKRKEDFIESAPEQLHKRAVRFRNELRCACFTEDVEDSHMWGIYADSGKGIAVEYELDPRALTCHCKQKCGTCACATLAPVLYEGRPNVSWLSHVLGGSTALSDYPEGTTYLYLINTAFKKIKQWEHEREWRVACGACEKVDGPMYLTAHAKAIYLGQKIGDADRRKVIEVTKNAGIPLYKMEMTDDPTGRLVSVPCHGLS
ncbi:DUF2971 domain-containing protein [Paratractidigestivibacter sp.]|uniref:DUF2971 domain-containing protein n=1 Tax=Paratractidigestivibacter sp. TaxID=2847316 RepID=UPI002AC8976A|nr:DUF2971 domain-containing protein [Paratractidigestivibacter sp.]